MGVIVPTHPGASNRKPRGFIGPGEKLVLQKADGLLPNLVLSLISYLQTNAVRILPKHPPRDRVARNELDFDGGFVADQRLNLSNAGKTGRELLGHGC